MKQSWRKTWFLVLAGLFWMGTLSAQEPSMGPLASIIKPGQQGAWSVSSGEKGVQLKNERSEGDITYFYVNENPAERGKRTVTLTVQLLNTTENALGGILYGFQENPKTYFLFTVGGNGSVNLHYRSENGFEQRMQSSLQGSPNDPVQLTIVEDGDQITLSANGRTMGSIGNDRIGRGGAVGIAAADRGVFRFSQFRVASQ